MEPAQVSQASLCWTIRLMHSEHYSTVRLVVSMVMEGSIGRGPRTFAHEAADLRRRSADDQLTRNYASASVLAQGELGGGSSTLGFVLANTAWRKRPLGETRPLRKCPRYGLPVDPLRERGPACTPNEVARAWISSPQDRSGSINCSATIRATVFLPVQVEPYKQAMASGTSKRIP